MTLAVNIAQSGSNNVTFRNRIINGAMTIAQYGTSTALPTGSSNGFSADRFRGFNVGTGACSIIQASNVPSSTYGFINSVQIDVTTADTSIAAGELYMIRQTIEGLNITDLAWGTANAKTITISFWVSSSKTGTHFVAFKNSAQDRCYAASYSVSVADTWEFKTITVAGDQSGTWLTTNGTGIQVTWALAVGSTYQTATANVWAAGDGYATSAQVNVMDSTANNFYITGVQLEAGTTASPFEYRQYGTELALCQRYYEQWNGASNYTPAGTGLASGTTSVIFAWIYKVTKRTAAVSLVSSSAAALSPSNGSGSVTVSNVVQIVGVTQVNDQSMMVQAGVATTPFTTGQASIVYLTNASTNYIAASAEL